MAAQDLDEPFDLCDRDGRLLGAVKPRGAVHRDGDWHRALHLWVVLTGDGPARVVLQRRSLAKDTHPGLVDVSVAGHLRAGESAAEALREAEEEIGLAVAPGDTTSLGRRRIERAFDGGLDREVQTVLATVAARPLTSLRPHPEEVAALYAPALSDALALARGERGSLDVVGVDAEGRPARAVLREADFVPADGPYRRRCLECLDALARGDAFTPLELAVDAGGQRPSS